MPGNGQIGSGIKLGYATASPHSWVAITSVRDVSGLPNRQRDKVETTIHGATSERSYIPGLSTVQDLVFTLRADLDSGGVHSQLKVYEGSQTELWFRCEVPVDPDLATTTYVAYTFLGRISEWNLTAPIDGLKEIEVTVLYSSSLMFQEEMAGVLP